MRLESRQDIGSIQGLGGFVVEPVYEVSCTECVLRRLCVHVYAHVCVCMDEYVHALLRVLFPLESSEGETIQTFL